jgi:IS605 OrfB family transposase
MIVRRVYRYRLCPNKTQAALLQATLDRCRELYNAALEERREAYGRAGISLCYADQSRQLPAIKLLRPEYSEINAQTLQDVLERLDFQNKQARKLADTFGYIAVEDLRVANMVRNHALAKSIADAGWAQFVAILSYKVAETGSRVIAVNPAGTSQVCSGCGQAGPKKDLSVRWHDCNCGLSLSRDHNAAVNILRAGQARRADARESPAP